MASSSRTHSEMEKEDGGSSVDHQRQQLHWRRTSLWLLFAGVVALCTLALGLGLGLGLGLRTHKQREAIASTSKFVSRDHIFDPSQLVLSAEWDRDAPPQERVYNFTLTEITSDAAAGVVKPMRVVNGISPGPLIEANMGDTVVVHVDNLMSVPTALHWHGQYQRGSNHMDGTAGVTECGIAPGSQFTYRWTVQQSGTYWWHSHYGPTYADGLFGPLILHGDDEAVHYGANDSTTRYDDDHIFVVNDAYQADSFTVAALARSSSGPDGTQGDEPTPDYAMINGLGFHNTSAAAYNFTVTTGERIRMRVINAGSLASFRFSVDGHNITVVEADGTEIEPIVVQSLTVMTAQRYSVIITADRAPGAYAVRAQALDDMFAYDNPDLVTNQYAIMRYDDTPASAQPLTNVSVPNSAIVTESLDVGALIPRVAIDPPAANATTTLVVNFGLDAESDWHAFFNQSTFTSEMAPLASLLQAFNNGSSEGTAYAPNDELVVTTNEVVVMDVVVNNLDEGSHPFHLHGYTPYLIGSGSGNYQGGLSPSPRNPMRRDVFSVEPYSWMAFRFVADNPGIWAFHCHLMPHMAIGLLMQFQVLPHQIASLAVPTAQMLPQCSAVHSWVSANTNLLTNTS